MNKLRLFNSFQLCFYLKCSSCKRCYQMTLDNRMSRIDYSSRQVKFISSNYIPKDNYEETNKEFSSELSNNISNKRGGKEGNKDQTKKIKKLSTKRMNSLISYLQSNSELLSFKDVLISAFTLRDKDLYLMDKNVARDLSKLFVPDLTNGSSVVIEGNPGLGFVTELLLNAKVPYFCLYESNPEFVGYLNNKSILKNIPIRHFDIFKFWKLQYIEDTSDEKVLRNSFMGLTARKWEDEPPISVICTISSKKFVNDIMNNIIHQNGFVKIGRPQFFIIMNSLEYNFFTANGLCSKKSYRPLSVLFQIFFDYKILSEIPRSAFLPYWDDETKKVRKSESMYLVKLTPHRELYANSFDRLLPLFQHFLKQLFTAPRNRIIPLLEQWKPGCGPKFFLKGIDIYTEVGELSPKSLLDIFLELMKDGTPSSFLASLELLTMKKKSTEIIIDHPDDNDNDDNDDDNHHSSDYQKF